MKHPKKLTKDNVATFLQTLLVLFLLGYSAVNGNAVETAPLQPTVQQQAVILQPLPVTTSPQQPVYNVKKKAQLINN